MNEDLTVTIETPAGVLSYEFDAALTIAELRYLKGLGVATLEVIALLRDADPDVWLGLAVIASRRAGWGLTEDDISNMECHLVNVIVPDVGAIVEPSPDQPDVPSPAGGRNKPGMRHVND